MSARNQQISEVRVDSLLRTNPTIDGGWFWSKYSANPYIGCRYGCTYCFLRQKSYGISENAGGDQADPFSENIQVCVNAAEVLDRELAQVHPDIIIAGDYQPIDSKYRISRQILDVCLKHGFPTMVIVKSPAVLQDLDIIQKINKKSWACVVFSIAFSESSSIQKIFEPSAATIESRWLAMKKIAESGIYTGTSLIPVMPSINDSDENLKNIILTTRKQGGQFVMAGGLVLGDQLEDSFFKSLRKVNSDLPIHYQNLYQGGHSPHDDSWRALGKKVKQWCLEEGLNYRIKRYIPHGPHSLKREKAEELFLKVYEMEIEGVSENQISELRKSAMALERS